MAPVLVDPITGAVIEIVFTELLEVIKNIASSKTRGKELKEKLESLKPMIDQIYNNFSESEPSPDIAKQFKDFQVVLKDGLELVEKLEKVDSFDFFKKYRYGKKICEFERKVFDFLRIHGPPNVTLSLQKLDADFRGFCQRFECLIETLIEIATSTMTINHISNTFMLQQINPTNHVFLTSMDGMQGAAATQQAINCTYLAPDMPKFAVGLDNPVNAVKDRILQNGVNIVGVTGMGGSGKTTLASALCNDTRVKEVFQNNIIFITVSQYPNVKGLLDTMWRMIIGDRKPDFQSIEDAHNQLQKQLSLRGYRKTLVVLDDVWSRSDLEDLLFEAEGYKTIVTTRDDSNIPNTDGTHPPYKMPMLNDEDSFKFFCSWAISNSSIPAEKDKDLVKEEEDKDLIKEIAAECKGLPLALKVIGSYLNGEPRPVWESAKEKLSKAESLSKYHTDKLLNRLQISIDSLDDELLKQCFLDLGAFPQSGKFSIDSLLDIWVYVRGMERRDAFGVLLELAKKNLLNLESYPGNGTIKSSYVSELYFSQHDVMRDLALRLASQDTKRLFMPRKEDNIPTKWQADQISGAQFLSIHTDAMEKQDWCQIDFPEVEALALFFAASRYCLPTFLQTMPKLKVLIIYNYSSKRAMLSGLPNFPSPVQIRSVLLYKLTVPPLVHIGSWERLSVCLCEGLGNITLLDTEPEALNFPCILEINIDHCSDLRELPAKLCNLASLQMLLITNCHLIQNLPDDLGRLSSLRVLRLSACPALSRLPASICNLGQLEYLDISLCSSLKDLPSKFHELSNLKMLDMRECSGLKKLRKVNLKSLKHLIISDPEAEGEWLSLPNLKVKIVPERFCLDWLDG